MKKIIALCFATIVTYTIYASEITTTAKVTDVTVYLQGASITAKSQVQIPEGVSTVIISKQSEYIYANSAQVSGKGNFTILGVQFRRNYIDKFSQEKNIADLTEKRKQLDYTKKSLDDEIQVYKTETLLLEKNMELKGTNTSISILELEKAANFYRTRLLDIKKKQLDAQNKLTDVQKQIQDADKQLRELQNKGQEVTGEILVTVSSKVQQSIQLECNYYVAEAGWQPIYDIRVKDVASPVAITYKATVYQNTGVSWSNVAVRLSTGNPTMGGTAPVLTPWILRGYKPQAVMKVGYAASAPRIAEPVVDDYAFDNEVALEAKSIKSVVKKTKAVVDNKLTTIEFAINEPLSLVSNDKEALVTIQEYAIPAAYSYIAIPKLDKDAFLMAYIKGYEAYNFLSGNANLYFEGAFVGQSYFDTEQTQDSLAVSLGRDKGIQIERKRVDEYSDKKFIGQKRKQQFTYDILVRNAKSVAVPIIIQDQIPLSSQQDIAVESISHPEGLLDAKTGLVTWKFTLDKATTKKLQISFTVEYPKDLNVEGLGR
ncbi:MAG: hypothetical protein BWY22_01619 [Bacteroidetes bacterium ADurb.Bin217]|nr:MAG: hypothetical protein BWY22_01619 [Bacteroidetes bacterium ADurb.Bin217]